MGSQPFGSAPARERSRLRYAAVILLFGFACNRILAADCSAWSLAGARLGESKLDALADRTSAWPRHGGREYVVLLGDPWKGRIYLDADEVYALAESAPFPVDPWSVKRDLVKALGAPTVESGPTQSPSLGVHGTMTVWESAECNADLYLIVGTTAGLFSEAETHKLLVRHGAHFPDSRQTVTPNAFDPK